MSLPDGCTTTDCRETAKPRLFLSRPDVANFPVLEFPSLPVFTIQLTLEGRGYPPPSTPKNIDLHHSTPALIWPNFPHFSLVTITSFYYLVNST